jgi:transglutaminase-like putative cysteine protease
MRRCFLPLICLCFVFVPQPRAEEPKQAKVLRDTWDAAYAGKAKVGFFHTEVKEIEDDNGKFIRTLVEMNLSIRRDKDTVQLRAVTGSDETPEGKVLATSMIQPQGRGQQLVIAGKVVDKQLLLKITTPGAAKPLEKKIPWNAETIGLSRQETIFQDKKAKPGDTFRYLTFEPSIASVIGVTATIAEEEEVEVLHVSKAGEITFVKEKLLRAVTTPDKIDTPDTKLQLPSMTVWLDKELNTVRSETEIPGIPRLVLYRTTKEAANSDNGIAPDILRPILLNRTIPNPHETRAVVYRVTLKGDDDPKTAFADDTHQSIKNVKGNTFEIHVHPLKAPKPNDKPGKADAEFLQSCPYLDSDNDKVKSRAQAAISKDKDPWQKALDIESWVKKNMKNKNDVIFATAGQIAENLEGDCRQHAMLAAAMCRAVDVPSRTAVGLVYMLDEKRQPAMAFHMWAEVWIQGQWIPIDATLGKGHIGAAHIKISDHSWHDVQSLSPLLPLTRVFGKVSIEVVSVNGSE